MADRVKTFRAFRDKRDTALHALQSRVSQVREDIAARSPRQRLADKVREEATEAVDLALDVAAESKTVIAGTALALALWLGRNPIMQWVKMQLKHDQEQE